MSALFRSTSRILSSREDPPRHGSSFPIILLGERQLCAMRVCSPIIFEPRLHLERENLAFPVEYPVETQEHGSLAAGGSERVELCLEPWQEVVQCDCGSTDQHSFLGNVAEAL